MARGHGRAVMPMPSDWAAEARLGPPATRRASARGQGALPGAETGAGRSWRTGEPANRLTRGADTRQGGAGAHSRGGLAVCRPGVAC